MAKIEQVIIKCDKNYMYVHNFSSQSKKIWISVRLKLDFDGVL